MKLILGFVFIFTWFLVPQVWAQETALQDTIQAQDLYKSQNYPGAENALQAALKLDPNFASAHQLLGNVYVAENRREEAVAEYQKALALQPDNAPLKTYLQTLQASMPQTAATPAMQQQAAVTPVATAMATFVPTQTTGFNPDKPHGVFSAFGGLNLVGSNLNNQYAASAGITYTNGIDVGGYAGFAFDRHFSTEFKWDVATIPFSYPPSSYYGYTEPGYSYQIVSTGLLASSRYVFLDSGIRPYFTLGMGLEVGFNSAYEQVYTYPLVEGGIGGILPLSHDWDLYAEVDYDVIIAVEDNIDESLSYIPINIGVQFNAY